MIRLLFSGGCIIGWDRAVVDEDHEQLHVFLARVRAESDRARLATLLRELPTRLANHFRREEQPGGFFDALGVSLPEARGDVGRLVDDHFRLVSMARDLAEEALLPGMPVATLREQAGRMAGYLVDHEQLELELALRLVQGD